VVNLQIPECGQLILAFPSTMHFIFHLGTSR
jgi:hypothetical protein